MAKVAEPNSALSFKDLLITDEAPIRFLTTWVRILNLSGMGDRAFQAVLKEIVKTHQPNVLALVETHMGGDHAMKIASLLGYDGHTRVDAQGFSGGIWVYWKPWSL
ncbi:putative transcriptional regulatory protein NarL [Bienertia sinuspersici]